MLHCTLHIYSDVNVIILRQGLLLILLIMICIENCFILMFGIVMAFVFLCRVLVHDWPGRLYQTDGVQLSCM